jgi:hypothetical protein
MPFIASAVPAPGLPVTGLLPAAPGLRVDAYAPKNVNASGIPTPSSVVAWAQLADPDSVGGVRIDPVFLADGRVWTPDQFRAVYGESLELKVTLA